MKEVEELRSTIKDRTEMMKKFMNKKSQEIEFLEGEDNNLEDDELCSGSKKKNEKQIELLQHKLALQCTEIDELKKINGRT